MNIEEFALISKALSDINRVKIIKILSKETKCACHILEELQITQPTLSHHMKVLADCNLVNSWKDGKWNYYSINFERFMEFKKYIFEISCNKENSSYKSQNCCTNCN